VYNIQNSLTNSQENKGSQLNQCGGKYFKAKTLGVSRWEFGKSDSLHAMHGIEHKKLHGEIFLGPVRCKSHMKKSLFQVETADKEECCQNFVTRFDELRVLIGTETDLGCRGFYGIPYIAEVGIKGGVAIEGGLGGNITLNKGNCKAMGCIYGKGLVRPYLAIYTEVLAGIGGLEGGIDWEPHLKIGYCKEFDGKGKFKGELVPNTINLYNKAYGGWGLVETVGSKAIYQSGQPIKLF